jgi:hypothetical protein
MSESSNWHARRELYSPRGLAARDSLRTDKSPDLGYGFLRELIVL